MSAGGGALHVLMPLRTLAPNGITTYHLALARALAAAGHRVTLWPGGSRALAAAGSGWAPPGWALVPQAAGVLAPWVRRAGIDVVYVSHYTQARLAAALSSRTGVPWWVCMHNGHPPARMAQWQALWRTASGVVTLCERLHALYAPLAQAQQPALPQHRGALALHMPPFEPKPPVAEGEPLRLAYCARLSGSKGPRCATWLRAVAGLAAEQPLRARVIGGGSALPGLRRLARELGLPVHFTGEVPDATAHLNDVDVLAGAGYALLEGLVRGCAGVGLGFGGCWGAVTPERLDEAVAVNFGDHSPEPLPDSPEAVRDALRAAMALRREGGAQAVARRCRQRFDAQTQAASLVDFWRRGLSRSQ